MRAYHLGGVVEHRVRGHLDSVRRPGAHGAQEIDGDGVVEGVNRIAANTNRELGGMRDSLMRRDHAKQAAVASLVDHI